MSQMHFQSYKQASWLLSWFACFFLCGATVWPSCTEAQTTQAESSLPTKRATKQQTEDFEDRAVDSISRWGILRDKGVSESSGVARSAVTDCFWTINDSGSRTDLFLFLFGDRGKQRARVKLENAVNKDWEAMASFTLAGKHWVVVADIGNNLRSRETHQLYFFQDPTDAKGPPKSQKDFEKLKSVRALPFKFTYQNLPPDQAAKDDSDPVKQDCEAMAVDPLTLDIWFVEKVHLNRDRKVVPSIFVLPMPKAQLASHANREYGEAIATNEKPTEPVARRIGSFPTRYVSGMSFSPDGKKLIVRNYLTAHLYIRPEDKTWRQTVVDQKPLIVALPLQGQGEAICFAADSQHVIVTSEGVRKPIWQIDLQVYFDKFKAKQ